MRTLAGVPTPSRPHARRPATRPRRVDRPFPAPLESPHVIVMDNDLDDLERMGRLLSGRGLHITLSSTLLDADLVAFLLPDLIVVDPFMETSTTGTPDWRTSGRSPLQGVPVICCTASKAGALDLARSGILTLLKPVHPSDLLAAVNSLVTSRIGQARPEPVPVPAPGETQMREW